MAIQRIVVVTKRPSPEIKELSKHFEIGEKGELCVAVGGDGTFLEAARKVDCPILLIRSGETNSLGFHASVNLQELPKVIERLKKGDYSVEKHRKLRVTYRGDSFEAVNDAVLFRANLGAIHFKANYFDDRGSLEPLYPGIVRGDGIIISREIGSTAYNYFAHGPIILDRDIAVVTPICANYRFSIVSDHDFSIELLKNTGFLNCDGVKVGGLDINDAFSVSRSDKIVQLVRFKGMESFSGKLSRLIDF
ncbi:NAD(+)/NADH kinase [Candidatus Bathyarchaeota archaeon]|nr:NAD(+)/NADH kinase [Candidatus Bathyarchaeota archaeon]